MRLSDIKISSESKLRKEITRCNKAILGARSHPNGLSRWTIEDMERTLAYIREEIASRKK